MEKKVLDNNGSVCFTTSHFYLTIYIFLILKIFLTQLPIYQFECFVQQIRKFEISEMLFSLEHPPSDCHDRPRPRVSEDFEAEVEDVEAFEVLDDLDIGEAKLETRTWNRFLIIYFYIFQSCLVKWTILVNKTKT